MWCDIEGSPYIALCMLFVAVFVTVFVTVQELKRQHEDLEFSISVKCVAIIRYLIDQISRCVCACVRACACVTICGAG